MNKVWFWPGKNKVEKKFIAYNGNLTEPALEVIIKELIDFIKTEESLMVTSVKIGCWHGTDRYSYDYLISPKEIVSFLCENKKSLPMLKDICMGDLSGDTDYFIKDVIHCDYTPLFKAYPELETFITVGSADLILKPIKSKKLKKLKLTGTFIDQRIIKNIAKSSLPELEHLELDLGTWSSQSQGGIQPLREVGIEDIEDLMTKDLFPKLTRLGFRGSDISNEIMKSLKDASIINQLEVIDLSLGTLTEKGVNEFIKSDLLKGLKQLNIEKNYISAEAVKLIDNCSDTTVLTRGQNEIFEDEDEDNLMPMLCY
ncbi:MAG: hypothetical protein GY714_14325 [Desulfobacterales bacterium]|nr:hypothetical protein [Desulfobacterales bacterium]MCP4159579.1 hypothetical protein [Deltaproteobacteria bacterium]